MIRDERTTGVPTRRAGHNCERHSSDGAGGERMQGRDPVGESEKLVAAHEKQAEGKPAKAKIQHPQNGSALVLGPRQRASRRNSAAPATI